MLSEKLIKEGLKKIKPKEKYIIIHADITGLYFSNFKIKKLWNIIFTSFGKNKIYIMPSFNFKNNFKWSKKSSISETGLLSEYFRKNISNFRTLHPIHSVCVYGKGLHKFKNSYSLSSFGRGSIWEHICNSKNFANISLGTGFDGGATFCHYIEEKYSVPYREMINLPHIIIDNKKKLNIKFKYFARNQNSKYQNNWSKCYKELLKKGLVNQYKIGPSKFEVLKMNTHKVTKYLEKKLKTNLYYLVKK